MNERLRYNQDVKTPWGITGIYKGTLMRGGRAYALVALRYRDIRRTPYWQEALTMPLPGAPAKTLASVIDSAGTIGHEFSCWPLETIERLNGIHHTVQLPLL